MTLQTQKQSEVKEPQYLVRDDYYAMQPQEPISYLIENLITNASVNVFYGEPGSKKTYSLLSMAVAVANGKDWLGLKTKQSSVLFIDEESGELRFSRRLNESIKGESCDPNGKIKYISLAGFKLDDNKCLNSLKREIIDHQIQLVVIDALAEVMDGDENSKKDVQPVMAGLRKIADLTNCAFIIIHHSNKGGTYRGSSAIKAACDVMVQVESEPNQNVIDFNVEKNRDGVFSGFSAQSNWIDDKFFLTQFENNDRVNPKEKYILEYLFLHGESTVADIIKDITICKPEVAKKSLYNLKNNKKIIRTNPETGNYNAKYKLMDS